MKRVLVTLALSAASALLAVQAAAAHPGNGNRLLAKGTVTESVAPANWTISFKIHARGNGKSSQVDVTPGAGQRYSFDGSVCAGTYTDPTLGGTDVFVIGKVISGTSAFAGDDFGFYVIHVGADHSQVLGLPNLAAARSECANIVHFSPFFRIVSSKNVMFKV